MSDGLTFDDVLYHLAHNERADARAYAAQLLGDYVDHFSDEEYQRASAALNQALTDPDPTVILAVMQALSAYNRKARRDVARARQSADRPPVAIKLCQVCGKPESLADANLCPHANCPYK
ncbi:MAG: hypothetical protein NZ750_08980 [Anaerolineae bacterium]|nr:hypothetical protein [Anaerolineae bacterium]MDW8171751.1 hypothetical protein [Anaerolineae bacterium]